MTWEYLAGFFDGEGWIGIPSQAETLHISPRVIITQSKLRGKILFEEIKSFLSVANIKSTVRCAREDMWNLNISGRNNVILFIERLMPYLHIKKLEAQDIGRFLKLFPNRNEYKINSKRIKICPIM